MPPPKLQQLPLDGAQDGLSLIVGYLRLVPSQIENRTGLHFESAMADLGPMEALIAETPSGRQFGLYRLRNASLQEHTTLVVSEQTRDITDAVDEVLDALGIHTKEVRSFHLAYQFRPFKVLRQDDHGRVFTVDSFLSHSDASLAAKKLAHGQHKQLFWIEPDVVSREMGSGNNSNNP